MKLTLTFTSVLLVTAAVFSTANAETKITGDLPYVSKIEGSCKDREHTFLMTIQHDAYASANYGVMNLYVHDRVSKIVFGFDVPTTWFLSLNPLIVALHKPAA